MNQIEMAKYNNKKLHILVSTIEQLRVVSSMEHKPSRIYVDYHMCIGELPLIVKEISAYIDIYISLPYMLRGERNLKGTDEIKDIWLKSKTFIKGFLVRNMEELAFLTLNEDGFFDGTVVCDYGIYMWNHISANVIFDNTIASEGCIPYELNRHEIGEFMSMADGVFSACVYGYIPMMISADCIKKTFDNCLGKMGSNLVSFDNITDRKNNNMKVLTDCRQCLNIIYNSVPLSLHKQIDSLSKENNIFAFRVDLTIENSKDSENILSFWEDVFDNKAYDVPYKDYTTGHYKRGTE